MSMNKMVLFTSLPVFSALDAIPSAWHGEPDRGSEEVQATLCQWLLIFG